MLPWERHNTKAQSIFDYAPSSNGADDYRELVKEFLGRIKKINK